MMKRKKQAEIREDKSLKFKDHKIQNDIFSLAFASFVDPEKIHKGNGYLSFDPLTSREQQEIYLGALLVVCFQCTMIYLIINFMLTNDKFSIVPATSFQIIIPRLLSSIMMHLNVEPDIRNGINMMKWVVNHPESI